MNDLARSMIRRRMRDHRRYRDGRRYDIRTYENNDKRRDRAHEKMRAGYNPIHDETYDMAYEHGYTDAMNEGFHNELTPYGSRGMTVSDGRQGVKGTGRYGIGGSHYYGRDRAMSHEEMYLEEEDMHEWKRSLHNADGTMGEHFDLTEIDQAAKSLGIMPKDFTMHDLCMTANMLYSDYCDTLKNIIPKDKEAKYYAKLAEDFLDDKDSSTKGAEKLAAYYYCVIE